jgi:hypothetical protein
VRTARQPLLRGVPVKSLLAHGAFARCLRGLAESALVWTEEAARHAEGQNPAGEAMACGWWRPALHQFRWEPSDVERQARRAMELGASNAIPLYQHFGEIFLGWARIARGDADGGRSLRGMRTALHSLQGLQVGVAQSYLAGLVADACAMLGERAEGWVLIREALERSETTQERFAQAELWRIRAALSESSAETSRHLASALAVAERQGARWWALRAAADACEKSPTARTADRLRKVYAQFTEGFALRDLRRARALLEAAEPPGPSGQPGR